MTALAPIQPQTSNALMPNSMESALRLAEMMATGKLVPNHLQKSPGDCLMVIEQAMRWGMSPFAVAQSTSVIQGRLMFEGKLVAAALLSSGILSSRIEYEFSGEGDRRAITASATIRGESKPRTAEIKLSEVKTTNGMWVKQPDQQLIYSVNRVWARRHAPEVMLGVYSPEEFEQPAQQTSEPYTAGPTIPGTSAPIEMPAMVEVSQEDVLRARVDKLIGALALCDTEVKLIAREANSKKLLAEIDEAGFDYLKSIAIDALAFARQRIMKPAAELEATADDLEMGTVG
jgi:hypothetical protein